MHQLAQKFLLARLQLNLCFTVYFLNSSLKLRQKLLSFYFCRIFFVEVSLRPEYERMQRYYRNFVSKKFHNYKRELNTSLVINKQDLIKLVESCWSINDITNCYFKVNSETTQTVYYFYFIISWALSWKSEQLICVVMRRFVFTREAKRQHQSDRTHFDNQRFK